ncbi:MAG TPA: ferritin [bacterium]|nr:ferritin [bacterium]
MLSKKMEKMINDQMNFEIYSGYIYLAMGAYMDSLDLAGFANWMKVQWQEEFFHAQKMYNYLLERGGRPFLTEVPAPPKDWKSVKGAFEHALEHEQIVTGRINDIMNLAIKENDHATRSFLNWYVDEQVEEEASVDAIIKKLKLMKESGHGMYMLDKELGGRTFTAPAE